MGTVPGGVRDRHHVLYPHRIWRTQSNDIRDLRGGISFKINKKIHRQLHDEIDPTLGEDVDENCLPKESTLSLLASMYMADEIVINNMEPEAKIDWLLRNLDEADTQNTWLRLMLINQREFLKSHTEGR